MNVPPELPAGLFERLDATPDALFYREPRFVNHIDASTIDALSDYYAEILFEGAKVLDLMSSWVSHLPSSPALARLAVLGMNAAELDRNPRADERCVHDLNQDPVLPYSAASFDFVFIAVSIQYLVRPIEVLRDCARVLRPGGVLAVSMSHRCFPTKAIRAFHGIDVDGRAQLLAAYLTSTGAFSAPQFLDRSPATGDPLWVVQATVPSTEKR